VSVYRGTTALVTGAASGIGLALSRGLIARGAEVWLTDVDGAAVEAAARRLGDRAHGAGLDVTDAEAVDEAVRAIDEARGGLGYLFNNAGLGLAGEVHELGVRHFDRTLDVNVRGVTNGVAAAYPRMVDRGRGHIVNTASAAGLLPVPLLSAYAMSKHAVVGLSASLRLEAEHHGVQVSVLCPTAIETPLLDGGRAPEPSQAWRPELRRYLGRVGGAPRPVDDFVDAALRGVAANRGTIVWPTRARVAVALSRLAPALALRLGRRALAQERRDRPPTGQAR